jgi:type 1 glutamine amidotransferase
MTDTPRRAHLVAGGFPAGQLAGHDHDHARLKLLALLADEDVPASVANDFADVARWLPVSRLLITYVAGPYPDATQCGVMRDWIEAGGHWLALHGTSGGRARKVEGVRQRRTVKTEHHALLGAFFLTHPPLCRFRVDVRDADHPVTRGVGTAFEIEDEPYFVEIQDPASTRILLTADYGPGVESPVVVPLYGKDTSLQPDGKTRVLGYTRAIGRGAVTYIALGHCHNPASREGRPADVPTFRAPWESDAYKTLLRNAIAWSMSVASVQKPETAHA